jgi:hypothetical protein
MKGDFTRDSFNRLRHYSRVLQQQGRIELDADGNERQAILLHLVRSLAADLIGPHGAPGTGFQLKASKWDFVITKGHYYVDGWLCENDEDVTFAGREKGVLQPWWRPGTEALQQNKRYLAYLDVWERHISAAEADGAAERTLPTALREVALGGPDTTTRAQVVWQVKVSPQGEHPLPVEVEAPVKPDERAAWTRRWAKWFDDEWPLWRDSWQARERGRLTAKAAETSEMDTGKPCVVSPHARYRGLENQLYRIEIHRGTDAGQKPTFVWSRENGSVVFALERVDDASVKLVDGWRDARFGLAVGDVFELSDDDIAVSGKSGPLRRVTGVDLDTWTISFAGSGLAGTVDTSRHAVLRRWDHGHRTGAIDTRNANNDGRPEIADDLALSVEGRWLTIEDGISILFDGAQYRTGDYWLIPARTAIGDVLWPRDKDGNPKAMASHGVEHHYAPVAIVSVGDDGLVTVIEMPARFKTLVELSNPI